MRPEPRRLTCEEQLRLAQGRLRHILDNYIKAEAEVFALEQGRFRVVIFGSARIQAHDIIYRSIYNIAHALAEHGIDIITGGGPGLMEAANSGITDVVERISRSYGLPIDLPFIEEPANKHLEIKSSHRRFTSRLDEFMRLSNAVVVAPGGIGTMLEMIYVWQLLQVGLTNDRPMILLGRETWGGLLSWMQEVLLPHDYIGLSDFRWIKLVDTEQEVIDLVLRAQQCFQEEMSAGAEPEEETDRIVTAEVMAYGTPPTEFTEEGGTVES